MKRVVYTALLVLVMTGLALAAQDADGGEEAKKPNFIIGLVTAIIGGAGAVFVGWAKNRDLESGEHEPFDFKHAWPTLLLGGIVGVIGYFLDLSPAGIIEMFEQMPIYTVAIFGLEAAWKAVFRNTAATVQDVIKKIKAGSGDGGNSEPPSAP